MNVQQNLAQLMEPMVLMWRRTELRVYFQNPFLRALLGNSPEGKRALRRRAVKKIKRIKRTPRFIILVTRTKTVAYSFYQEPEIRDRIAPNYLLTQLEASRFEQMGANCSYCTTGPCKARLLPFEGELDPKTGETIEVSCKLRSLEFANFTSDSELTVLARHVDRDD